MTPELRDHASAFGKVSKKDIMLNNFLGGLAWGIGTVIGASAIVGAIGYILNKLGILGLVSSFFGN